MNNYVKHALKEFKAAGWMNDKEKFDDEMQEAICRHVIKLLNAFHGEGHSGTSAMYTISLFEKLAKFEPIAPLTGEDWEWNYVGDQNGKLYQNNRCSHVFKDDDGAYDIEGIIFYDIMTDEDGKEYKSHFTNRDSCVKITFPYTPVKQYKQRITK